MFSLVFYTYWSNIRLANCPRYNIRLASCFFGIARTHVFYYVLHALGQYQAGELLLQDRRIAFVLLRFTCIGRILDQRIASAGSRKSMFTIVFYTHLDSSRPTRCCCGIAWIDVSTAFCTRWKSIWLTSCFCGIARIHLCYCILYALGYYQTSKLLLWDRPKSNFLLRFTCIWAVSGWRAAAAESPEVMFSIVFYTRLEEYQAKELLLQDRPMVFCYCVLHALG